ncbi:MAG: nuclear transport factor 2 family protein [Pseudomonadota bacterium]
MCREHVNVRLLKQLNLQDLSGCANLFAEDFVWHFCNPKLPTIQGEYHGVAGLMEFFAKMTAITHGTFGVQPQSISAYGDELVVTHVIDRLTIDEESIETDAIVVWRIVDEHILEAWDIPAVHAVNPTKQTSGAV